jgi:hypothetical protein
MTASERHRLGSSSAVREDSGDGVGWDMRRKFFLRH